MLTQVAGLADRLVLTILESNPGYRGSRLVPEQDLWRSCHDNLVRILQLVGGEAWQGQEYYDAARATGRRRAEQGLPLDDLLRSFRMGGRLVWESLVAEARSLGTDDDALLDLGTRVWEVVDRSSAQVAAAYHEAERQRGARRRAAPRLRLGGPAHRGRRGPALRVRGRAASSASRSTAATWWWSPNPPSRDLEAVRRVRDRLAAARVVSAWQTRGAGLSGCSGSPRRTPARSSTRCAGCWRCAPGRPHRSTG